MLLLFAHGLTVSRGGARDCAGAWPDTPGGLLAAMRHAETVEGAEGLPVRQEWCAIFRVAPDGSRPELLCSRSPGRWVDRLGEPLPVQPYEPA